MPKTLAQESFTAFIINKIISKCIEKSKKACFGCSLKNEAVPQILHEHLQRGLLDTMLMFLEEVRAEEIQRKKILIEFEIFSKKEPSLKPLKDKVVDEVYLQLSEMNAYSMYYGRYVTLETYNFTREIFASVTKIRKRKRKTVKAANYNSTVSIEDILSEAWDQLESMK